MNLAPIMEPLLELELSVHLLAGLMNRKFMIERVKCNYFVVVQGGEGWT